LATRLIAVALAYLLTGWSSVAKDLRMRGDDAPDWTQHPTLGRIAMSMLSWPYACCIRTCRGTGQLGRGIAFGALLAVMQLTMNSTWICACLWLAEYTTNDVVMRVLLGALLLVPGFFVLGPLLAMAAVPLSLLLSWPLDRLFPLKSIDR
jgi:hypothetical protein